MAGATPKKEMIRRLRYLVQGLKNGGKAEAAEDLSRAVRSLQNSVPAEAPIEEVVIRTLGTIIRMEVTLDGQLVSTLAHVAREVGVRLADNPALLLSVALASHDNPDREFASERVDAVAETILSEYGKPGEEAPYEEVLNAAHRFAEMAELPSTVAGLEDLRAELDGAEAAKRAETAGEQKKQLEEAAQQKPPEDNPDWGWAIKALLTILSLIAAAGAVLDAIDDPVGTARRLWAEEGP